VTVLPSTRPRPAAVDDAGRGPERRLGVEGGRVDHASAEERARRRHRELGGRGEAAAYEAVLDDIRRRDVPMSRPSSTAPPGAPAKRRCQSRRAARTAGTAEMKLFITASAEERARRRHRELGGRGEAAAYEAVLDDMPGGRR
jgi:cytidylate kinase